MGGGGAGGQDRIQSVLAGSVISVQQLVATLNYCFAETSFEYWGMLGKIFVEKIFLTKIVLLKLSYIETRTQKPRFSQVYRNITGCWEEVKSNYQNHFGKI